MEDLQWERKVPETQETHIFVTVFVVVSDS